jgi:hypothetical protein
LNCCSPAATTTRSFPARSTGVARSRRSSAFPQA